jgi:peptidylprolyl isomerase
MGLGHHLGGEFARPRVDRSSQTDGFKEKGSSQMAHAKNGDIVKIHYTGKLHDGRVFASSEGGDPLEFQLGKQQVLAGIDKAVVGMNVDESKTTTIPASDAFGPRRDELVAAVKRAEFPDDIKPEVSERLLMRQANGQEMQVTVIDADDDSVTLDGNHPLAGKDLTFDLQLVEIG